MRMISDHCNWLIGLCIPLCVAAADQPCNLTGAERVGQGWLEVKKRSQGVLTFFVPRKQFESPTMPRAWTVSLQARDAALKGFTDYFRKVSPPATEGSVLLVKGMQSREVQCSQGVFFLYEVNLANLVWEIPSSGSPPTKDETVIPIDGLTPNEPRVGFSASVPKQPLMTPLGVPKVVIED